MNDAVDERVREVIADIPSGRVLTYGDVAARAGVASARIVGRILGNPDRLRGDVPADAGAASSPWGCPEFSTVADPPPSRT